MKNHTDFGQFCTNLTDPEAQQPSNHTDFGQFQTATDPQPSPLNPRKSSNHTDFVQFCSETNDPQSPEQSDVPIHRETLNPLSLWQRQPNEPAADYQLFIAWLELPAPRRCTQAAKTLACSVYRLRQLAKRYDWRSRAAAFDNHRADASSRALEHRLEHETLNWQERAQRFRDQEWTLHEGMLKAADAALAEFGKRPKRLSLQTIAKIHEVSSTLGRRSLGLPLDYSKPRTPPPPTPMHPTVEEALHRVYGSPPETNNTPKPQKPSAG